MCGIAGIYSQDMFPSQGLLRALLKHLAHRGPDGEALEIQGPMGLVHRRLAIVDLKTGQQPLRSPDGCLLVVNGEIYNSPELRASFPAQIFHTLSDCEVIIPLYQKYGLDFPAFLRGMYALALYDPDKERLVLARDLFGMKQLYYGQSGQGFFFASEIKALLKAGLASRDIDPDVRTELLQLRYTTGPKTLFRGIYRVLPGEVLVIDRGQIVARHQQAKPGLKETSSDSRAFVSDQDEVLKLFDETLRESVRLHLRSDVPCGLFLSGGLDSASLLAVMAQAQKETGTPLKTYTIGCAEKSREDERPQAAFLSQHFGTDHQDIRFSQQDFWSLLPAVVQAMDDLIFDPAMIPTFKLASVARQDVKVILSGEGGDELLAGYRRYQKVSWPTWLGGGRLCRDTGIFQGTPLKNLLSPWEEGLKQVKRAALRETTSRLQAAQKIDFETWLPNTLLLKLDRCLMAHGLEGRTPYLDREMFAHLFWLPDHWKIHRFYGKWVLRKWLLHHVPEANPFSKKQGFKIPHLEWMSQKASRLAPLVARQEGIQEFLSPEDVMTIFSLRERGYAPAAWALLIYALWHQAHVVGIEPLEETLVFLSRR